jgi:hypothetical protein
MSRKRTGLRNRFRNGRGKYSTTHKARKADRYGEYSTGKLIRSELIAGNVISDQLPRSKVSFGELS